MSIFDSKDFTLTTTRRKFPRRRFKRKMGILFEGKYWVGHGLEIGEGGVSFLLGQSLTEGKNLVVNFQVPGSVFVSVSGEIRYLKKDPATGHFLYGIAFRTLKFEHKREIRAYVSARQEFEN